MQIALLNKAGCTKLKLFRKGFSAACVFLLTALGFLFTFRLFTAFLGFFWHLRFRFTALTLNFGVTLLRIIIFRITFGTFAITFCWQYNSFIITLAALLPHSRLSSIIGLVAFIPLLANFSFLRAVRGRILLLGDPRQQLSGPGQIQRQPILHRVTAITILGVHFWLALLLLVLLGGRPPHGARRTPDLRLNGRRRARGAQRRDQRALALGAPRVQPVRRQRPPEQGRAGLRRLRPHEALLRLGTVRTGRRAPDAGTIRLRRVGAARLVAHGERQRTGRPRRRGRQRGGRGGPRQGGQRDVADGFAPARDGGGTRRVQALRAGAGMELMLEPVQGRGALVVLLAAAAARARRGARRAGGRRLRGGAARVLSEGVGG